MVPRQIPPIFPGDQVIVYKRFANLNPEAINVYFENHDNTECWTIELDENDIILDDMVPILMARRRIQELDSLRLQEYSDKLHKQHDQEIIELACRYGLMSSLTSYIAIETRPDADPNQPVQYRRVPIALTRGWGGIVCAHKIPCCSSAIVNENDYLRPVIRSRHRAMKKIVKIQPHLDHDLLIQLINPCNISNKFRTRKHLDHDLLIQLINLQKCDGYWEYNKELAELFGFTPSLYHKISIEQCLGFGLKQPDEVIATILVLDMLEKRFKQFETEWILVAEKGYQWLQKQNIDKPKMQIVLQIVMDDN